MEDHPPVVVPVSAFMPSPTVSVEGKRNANEESQLEESSCPNPSPEQEIRLD
jgi:hypothetical protein